MIDDTLRALFAGEALTVFGMAPTMGPMSNRVWPGAVLLLVSWPVGAYGYIDPGSGLLLFQGLVSVVVGGLFIARRAISRAVSRIAGALGLSQDKPSQPGPPGGSS